MGSGSSKQRMGERVTAGRRKLEHGLALQSERVRLMESTSPKTLEVAVESIAESFSLCSPFLEGTLLTAFKADPKRVEEVVTASTRKVLSAPIKEVEWDWFKQYVVPSSVWMLRTADDSQFMFERLMEIAKGLSQRITAEMDSIYDHLQTHKDWESIVAIKNKATISRQDDDAVGLLRDRGITEVLEAKQQEDDAEGHQELTEFVESNLAVSMLTATAKRIDPEFQCVMKAVMTPFGDYKAGPIKKVDRCVSKLENDYRDEAFPKAAKLLDLVRCSVSFNTVSQLVAGYRGFMKYIGSNQETMKIARIKNGFIGDAQGGYRDLKICVVFTSATDPTLRMICEVQLLLNQYLFEKKKLHKLYSVVRDEVFYRMVVKPEEETTVEMPKMARDIKAFEPILNLRDDVEFKKKTNKYSSCCAQSELELLCVKPTWRKVVSCIDMVTRKVVFETKSDAAYGEDRRYINGDTVHWLNINDRHYLSVQSSKNVIKFFSVDPVTKRFTEDQSLRITLPNTDVLKYAVFDQNAEHVFLLKNDKVFEQHAVSGGNGVVMTLTLNEVIEGDNVCKQIAVSNDGTLCAIAGGEKRPYWYLIDILGQKQMKITSQNVQNSYAPCFVNGDNELIVIGAEKKFEVWNLQNMSSLKVIGAKKGVWSTCSVNNLLAVGVDDGNMYLYDVKTWNMIYSKKYEMRIFTLHLTSDLKYLTVAGGGTPNAELCVVLNLK